MKKKNQNKSSESELRFHLEQMQGALERALLDVDARDCVIQNLNSRVHTLEGCVKQQIEQREKSARDHKTALDIRDQQTNAIHHQSTERANKITQLVTVVQNMVETLSEDTP